jgi:sterol desaturase/sphingolipid hydroxylase (fatty acid hydroxylase superfamily)
VILARLFRWQPTDTGPRLEPWLRLGYALFAVVFALTVVADAFVHETITLGPGLVDEPDGGLPRLLAQLGGLPAGAAAATAAICLLVLAWNGVMLYRGFDAGLPRRQLLSFFLLNGVFTLLLYGSLAVAAALSAALGHGLAGGFDAVRHLTDFCRALVARIPTLVHLPYPLPLLASIAAVDLFHYGFHRLGHTFRPFWLLWHRPHHMTPWLTIPTTQPVFAAFPLFLLLSVPFQIGVGLSARLFSSETMVLEALLFRVIGQVVAIGSHNTSLYSPFYQNRLLRALSALYGEGPYHYMHHSALPEHGLVNLGGPFFLLWDRLFGTYAAPTAARPPAGLTGSPRMHGNPLRLALAGLLQLGYELRANRGWRVRLAILFGPTRFTPPHTRDYALAEEEVAEVHGNRTHRTSP